MSPTISTGIERKEIQSIINKLNRNNNNTQKCTMEIIFMKSDTQRTLESVETKQQRHDDKMG